MSSRPKVVLTTIGKFHSFDLARELHQRDMLSGIYSGYPTYKLQNERLPQNLIHSFPYLHVASLLANRLGKKLAVLQKEISWWDHVILDRYVAQRLPRCDAFVGLSSSGLLTGRKAQQQGAMYICDRGSSHIRYQDQILRDEYKLLGIHGPELDPRRIEREEAEYKQADFVTVPSEYVRETFLERGFSTVKVVKIPYGVNLSRFEPVGKPNPERFDVLFVGSASVRKGIHYLLEAFHRLPVTNKQLTFVGMIQPIAKEMIDRYLAQGTNIVCLGHMPQPRLKEVMSTHHVMVLPSIEEGLALVQAQAMACGCPVIATTNTGGADLFTDGKEGYVVPIRDSNAIQERLQYLSEHPEVRERLSGAALARVQSVGGWTQYGESFAALVSSGKPL